MSAPKAIRPKLEQETPAELVKSIIQTVREVYCPGMSHKEWFETHQKRILEWCVLEPATFIVSRNFTLPGDRFKEILVDIITDSKRNATGTITYLPAYLRKCVQSHFEIHWVQYHDEAKRINNTAEAAFLALKQLPRTDRTVETIAEAAREMRNQLKPGPKKKPDQQKLAKPDDQPTLF